MYTSATSLPFQLKKAGFITEIYPYNIDAVHLTPDFIDNVEEIGALPAAQRNEVNGQALKKIHLIAKFNFAPHYLKKTPLWRHGALCTSGSCRTGGGSDKRGSEPIS